MIIRLTGLRIVSSGALPSIHSSSRFDAYSVLKHLANEYRLDIKSYRHTTRWRRPVLST